MTLSLLELYNATASQEWAMYDNDATSTEEMESSLVLALNKSILEIYTSYEFPFLERGHIILTMPGENTYSAPPGLIKKDSEGRFIVKYNTQQLENKDCSFMPEVQNRLPEYFYIKNDNIVFYPTPPERGMALIDYYTLAVGESADGKELFSLTNADDILSVPEHLKELMKNAIITRTMLNTISSEADENYSAYQKQALIAYKKLIKYSKILYKDKKVKL